MRLFSFSSLFVSLTASLALAAAACGGKGSSAVEPSEHATSESATDSSCPVAVAGTSVTVEDTATGAALVFVTTGDVADVRRRVAAMAAMHNDVHGKMGPLPTGEESGGHDHGAHGGHGGRAGAAGGEGEHAGHAGGMISVHSRAEATDIDGGASLAFVAGGADVGKLQSELRMHAQHLSSGTCAMGSH